MKNNLLFSTALVAAAFAATDARAEKDQVWAIDGNHTVESAIVLQENSDQYIKGVVFTGNANVLIDGIRQHGGDAPEDETLKGKYTRNTITDNTGAGAKGGFVDIQSGTATITNGGSIEVTDLTISGGTVNVNGGDIRLLNTDDAEAIKNNGWTTGSLLNAKNLQMSGGTVNVSDGAIIGGENMKVSGGMLNVRNGIVGTKSSDNFTLDGSETVKSVAAEIEKEYKAGKRNEADYALFKEDDSRVNTVKDTLWGEGSEALLTEYNKDLAANLKYEDLKDGSFKTNVDEATSDEIQAKQAESFWGSEENQAADNLSDDAKEKIKEALSLESEPSDENVKEYLSQGNALGYDDIKEEKQENATYEGIENDKLAAYLASEDEKTAEVTDNDLTDDAKHALISDEAVKEAYLGENSGDRTDDDFNAVSETEDYKAYVEAAQLAAMPVANFDGDSIIKGTTKVNTAKMNINSGTTVAEQSVSLVKGELNIRSGAELDAGENTVTIADASVANIDGTLTAADTTLNASTVNLTGELAANVTGDGSSVINVNSTYAKIKKLTSLNDLNIKAAAVVSELLEETSNVTNVNVAQNASLTLDVEEDKDAKLTADNLNISGRVNVVNDYKGIDNATVEKGGVLDLGTNTLASAVTLENGATMNVGVAQNGEDIANGKVTSLTATSEDNEKANVNLVIATGVDAGKLATDGIQIADSGVSGNIEIAGNHLFNINADALETDGKITAEQKSQSEVAASLASEGINGNQSAVIAAFTTGLGEHEGSNDITKAMSEMIQSGSASQAADMAEALAPETNPVLQAMSVQTTNQIFGAASQRMSNGSITSGAQGKASGDNIFARGAAWVQGLFNKTKYDKGHGFDIDSEGLAMGVEKMVNDDVKAGVGYAYTNADIDSHLRSSDVDTHSVFVYGEYKPSDWFVNGTASYSWSDYAEKKNVAGKMHHADYDVDTFGLQAMSGVNMNLNGYKLTPSAGLRYVRLSQDNYTDTAGQRVKGLSSDILTAVAEARAATDVTLENGITLRPEARLAMTYDLMNDDADSVVSLSNGSAYRVKGEALDRFGVEFGAGVSADVNDDIELSLGYEGRFRQDYQDHTGLLNAKYKF